MAETNPTPLKPSYPTALAVVIEAALTLAGSFCDPGNAAVIVMIGGCGITITIVAMHELSAIHLAVNSKMDEMLETTKAAYEAIGELKGRKDLKHEQDVDRDSPQQSQPR